MRRIIFVVSVAFASAPALAAQNVPARDLLTFPLGTMIRAAALANAIGDGLGNPAAIILAPGDALTAGAAALQTTPEQGVSGQLAAVRLKLPRELTMSISLAHAAVGDLVRTETDPQSLGDDIPYATTLVSLALARKVAGPVVLGGAARYRRGSLDATRKSALGFDAGLYAQSLPFRDLTLGVSTFLWSPGSKPERQMAINAGADLRMIGEAVDRQVRAGYGFSRIIDGQKEHFIYLNGRYGAWEATGGFARADTHGWQSWRSRLGVTVHVSPYSVGVAREENGAGLGPTLQFTLGARIH